MRVLYPQNPLNSLEADEPYQEEYRAVLEAGIGCSLFDFDALPLGGFQPKPKLTEGEEVLYRGWMITPDGYGRLVASIEQMGGSVITSVEQFASCHHLPNWYARCEGLTAESHFFRNDKNLESNVADLGWDAYFVKDFVKSNTADLGSIARSPGEVLKIVAQIALYRGEIEGGVAIRRVENYRLDTERRYFVVRGTAYSHNGEPPDLVKRIAMLIQEPFYSVDVIETVDGQLRLVELGDGQVSGKKDWPLGQFVEVIAANT